LHGEACGRQAQDPVSSRRPNRKGSKRGVLTLEQLQELALSAPRFLLRGKTGSEKNAMKHWLRDNSLSITLFMLFALSLIGHGWAGWLAHNEVLAREGWPPLSLLAYLAGGEFGSTVFENWESEFLQMAVFVVLTAFLFQRGSPESNDPDKPSPRERDPKADADKPDAPWPVRAGGVARTLYAHSLGIALALLFVASFVLHWINSTRLAADEAMRAGEAPPTLIAHLTSAQLWFESFQNWQSEFLSTGVLIVLAIFLRERGSPESKAVGAPHAQTGNE
jgi:hypothetical protein